MNGAERFCAELDGLGVRIVFGLPGTQNIGLFDALRRAGVRTVTASDEGAAAFMAGAHARAAGCPAVLTTIPGPGFVYALAGIVEACHDSAPIVWVTLRQPADDQAYPLQRIDQAAMAQPVVKAAMYVDRADQLANTMRQAWHLAGSGEPGPVLVEISSAVLTEPAPAGDWPFPAEPSSELGLALSRIAASRRPAMYVGQGAIGAAPAVRALAERWGAPVMFSCSGRGILPDAHPLACVGDFSFGPSPAVQAVIDRADLVLVLGCKFTHNGSAGGRLRLPADKLVRVDASREVLGANYPAAATVCGRVEAIVPQMSSAVAGHSEWDATEVAALRAAAEDERFASIAHEPLLDVETGVPLRSVFAAAAKAFGDRTIYVADAGLHQALTRRYADVVRPAGLLVPSDFQSMGFGLAGGIGAAVARPECTVVSCVGDGALNLSLGDLATAVREGVGLVVMVFDDGAYGLIARQQMLNYGSSAATQLPSMDYGALAQAVGCSYFPASRDLEGLFAAVRAAEGVRLVHLALRDAESLGAAARQRARRETIVRALPAPVLRQLKRWRS